MYTILESIHVWGLALFVGFTALLDLRLLGWRCAISDVHERPRFFPFMVGRVHRDGRLRSAALLCDPVRTYQSVFFQGQSSLSHRRGAQRRAFSHDRLSQGRRMGPRRDTPRRARLAGGVFPRAVDLHYFLGADDRVQLVRLRRQPQPPIVNWAAGCVVEPETE